MSFDAALELIGTDPAVRSMASTDVEVIAIPESARALALAAAAKIRAHRYPGSKLIVVTPSAAEAEHLAEDLEIFLGEEVATYPAWETLPFERVSPNIETMGARMRTMHELKSRTGASIVLTSVRAVLQQLSPHVEELQSITLKRSETLDQEELVRKLAQFGYRREYQVEHRGEFSVRGSIVDIYPSTFDQPIRIDFWGDEIDRLTEFSVSDQRSSNEVEKFEIFPARELLPTPEICARAAELKKTEKWASSQWEQLAEGNLFDGMESFLPWLVNGEHVLFDLLGEDDEVILVEPKRLRDRAQELLDEEHSLATTLAQTWGAETDVFPSLHIGFDRLLSHSVAKSVMTTAVASSPDIPKLHAVGFEGRGDGVQKSMEDLLGRKFAVTIFADGSGTADRMSDSFAEGGVTVPVMKIEKANLVKPGARIVAQPLERGAIFPSLNLALITEADITGRRRSHRQPRARRVNTQAFFEGLKAGDYVVHYHHGVGRYAGMIKRKLGDSERDYLLLEYRGDDKLYIPSDQIDTIRAYTGGDSPSLSKLGGADWERTKQRVRKAVQEIAQELLVIYQRRMHAPGHAFPIDTPWQFEMEAAFPFRETPDQLKAIDDVKADMEAERPMDRLVCGDVGFGKTEVAMRAAFKAVQEGMQVAVLVPTTLLAQQHFQTFSDRFAGFPVRVEVLSRFLTNAEAKKIVQDTADGNVDVLIGTHRLLSGDVTFKNLGLLVVDEEQRFGVMHKEQMKKFRANVDVLTLTATPIPRTLEMSLTGIRDLSLLNTPPAARQPILTYVGEYDERAVAEAIRRELLREGQVFFVHNRVQDIDHVAERIKELVPEARVGIAHGQMDEGTLERTVLDFWEGKFDVLVCTTIIESGIDMPSVNTLVVDRAERLGLGQLHQLRGRVGRSGQRAYAYLFYPPDISLSEDAYERLRTIGEHTELGSGFKIAMRDLEIRGAGNLLSGDQSGHIAAVGYDLYVQMVSESISELKGVEPKEPAEIKLDLNVQAYLPESYVTREDLRLDAYRRLASVVSIGDVEDIRNEWIDRYGPLPEEAEALLRVGMLRAHCARIGITDISVARDVARISPIDLKSSQQIRLQRISPKAVYKDEPKQLVLPIAAKAEPSEALGSLLEALYPLDEDVPLTSAPA